MLIPIDEPSEEGAIIPKLLFWGGSHDVSGGGLQHGIVGKLIPEESFTDVFCHKGDCIIHDGKTLLKTTSRWKQEFLYVIYAAAEVDEETIPNAAAATSTNIISDNHIDFASDGKNLVSNEQKFEIRNSATSGRSMFATMNISYGELIHAAPGLLIPKIEYDEHGVHTPLSCYVFNVKSGDKMLAFGYGSMFNHSSRKPNVDYR